MAGGKLDSDLRMYVCIGSTIGAGHYSLCSHRLVLERYY